MTREEAIQCIKHELLITVNRKDLTGQAIGEALDMAIEALSERTGEWSERIKAEICDDICRYPYQFNEDEQAELDAICAKCPLERVWGK